MSVEALKTSSTGFLREFHFSTLAQGVIDDLMGEVERPSWMTFAVNQTSDPLAREILFTITVRIAPHKRTVILYEGKIGVGSDKPRRFDLVFPVPERVLVEFRDQLPTMFANWLKSALLENAYKLYEADPRIGFQPHDMVDELVPSPLFDPPERFSRTGLPVNSLNLSEFDEKSYEPPHCAFCGAPHSMRSAPVWAGANLMWIHPRCWRTSS